MSIKRMTANGWHRSGTFKRYTGTEWATTSTACRREGGQWIDIWQPSGSFTKSYELTQYASYTMANGQRVTNVPLHSGTPVLMQGSSTGKTSDIVSTMMFFPTELMRNDLHDATLNYAVLELTCVDMSAPGVPGYLLLHYGSGYSECPAEWDGTDSGDADSGSPTVMFSRTSTYNVSLNVVKGLLDGSVDFLALNAISRRDYSYYMLFDASSARLILHYSR